MSRRRQADYVPKDPEALRMWQLARCSNALYEAFLGADSPTGEMLAMTIKDVRDIAMAQAQTINSTHKNNEAVQPKRN